MGISSCNSHEYEGRCLEVLIPSLNDTSKALDDSVLASAMLLRLLEEMSGRCWVLSQVPAQLLTLA